jgi:hypothetical protein
LGLLLLLLLLLLLAVESLLLLDDEEKSRLEEKHDTNDGREDDIGSVVAAAAAGVTLDVGHVAAPPNLALDVELNDDPDDVDTRPLRIEAFRSRQAALILDDMNILGAGIVWRSWS